MQLFRSMVNCDGCKGILGTSAMFKGRNTTGVLQLFGDGLSLSGFERNIGKTVPRPLRVSLIGILFLAILTIAVLQGECQAEGDEPTPAAKQVKPVATQSTDAAKDAVPAASKIWPEGTTVEGRVLDHLGAPVPDAEILLLGKEQIVVDALRRNWFVSEKGVPSPPSTRTDKNGSFTVTRKDGIADRLAVIAEDPLLWVIPRDRLTQENNFDINLPEAGSLAIQCDLPGKSPKQSVEIVLRSFDGVVWNTDFLQFRSGNYKVANPGETVFEHLPPGHYTVQRKIETKTGPHTVLMTSADRRLVEIESAKRSIVHIDRKIGRPISGQVRGLENAELREGRVTISHSGPEEVLGKDGKRKRMFVAFDVIPVSSDGSFTIDRIPPGEYTAELFAVLASTPQLSSQSSDFSGRSSFTVPEEGDLPVIDIIAKANVPLDLSTVTDLRLRAIDEEGKPVLKFEAKVFSGSQGYGTWSIGRKGLVFLGRESQHRGAAIEALVRADGYAPMIARFASENRDRLSQGEAEITLRRGQKVQLRFNLPKEMTWPKGALPEAYFDDLQDCVRVMRQPSNRMRNTLPDFNMLNLHDLGEGCFEFWLDNETPPFHVAIHAPGFLQYFEAGTFTLADVKDGTLEIEVPRPAMLDISFEPGDHPGSTTLFKSATLDLHWQLQGNQIWNVASEAGSTLTPQLKVTDLAPGNYSVSVRTQPKEDSQSPPGTEINVGAYHDHRTLTLKSGQSERIEFRSTPFDPNAFRGTRTAVVRLRTPDGEPAKDRNVSVTYYDGHYGSILVFSTKLPASGEIVLEGITDESRSSRGPYQVRIDDKSVGFFGFTKESLRQEFEFFLAPGIGDEAPDLDLTNVVTGNTIRLGSLRGKVVFLEFWATWCGPCQEPMAKLNALSNEQRVAWKDRVVIVPVSIDSEQTRIKLHVQKNGWNGLEHFWSGGSEGDDFESPAARAYVVSGVPEAVLIGPDGRILWRGHPLDKLDGKDLKSRIDDALK